MQKIISLIILQLFILSGCMPLAFTALTTTGVSATGERSISDVASDVKITNQIKADLFSSDANNLWKKVHVTVVEGNVLYTGSVSSEDDILKATEIAWNNDGVKSVANELTVDSDSNSFDLAQYTRDSMITMQIKSKILLDKGIKFANYTVITQQDIVYIFGIALSEQELEKVSDIASKINKVKKVVSYVKIKEFSSTNE